VSGEIGGHWELHHAELYLASAFDVVQQAAFGRAKLGRRLVLDLGQHLEDLHTKGYVDQPRWSGIRDMR
jgi:hypothetical protein